MTNSDEATPEIPSDCALHQPDANVPESPKSPPPLDQIVEALLFVGGEPLSVERACETIRGLTPPDFTASIDTLNRKYRNQKRPYTIRVRETGYVLELRPQFHTIRSRFVGENREARLSAATIDALALIAYRQPITKSEVDALRGVDTQGVLRQLVRRGLIQIVQPPDANRHEVSYGTTQRFLDTFGLTNLDDLPQTQDLQSL